MFINATGFYVPEERVDNQHFLELNGLTSEWIEHASFIFEYFAINNCYGTGQ